VECVAPSVRAQCCREGALDLSRKAPLKAIKEDHTCSNFGSRCALDQDVKKKGMMLRITRIDTLKQQKLILEGQLSEPWIADLGFHWEEARHSHPEREFVVDLTGVTRSIRVARAPSRS
jgi:hypothetical protein